MIIRYNVSILPFSTSNLMAIQCFEDLLTLSNERVLVTEMMKLVSNSIHFHSQYFECFHMADLETSMPNLP